jgi:hypothetical protein
MIDVPSLLYFLKSKFADPDAKPTVGFALPRVGGKRKDAALRAC